MSLPRSGFDVEMCGMGVAAGDYDNDGRDDLYVTTLEGDRLFHNEGSFKFRDVTKASGIVNAHFGTSAAWLDYDRDGRLDLFVANYVQWTRGGRRLLLAGRHQQVLLHARVAQRHRVEAVPQSRGGKVRGRHGAGPVSAIRTSKSLGVAVLDYDGDGWPDIFVANDTQPNKLYRQQRQRHVHGEGRRVPAWRSQRMASRAARWAPTRPTTTDRAVRICSSATSPTRCSRCIATRATGCSSTRRRAPRRARQPACRSPSASSSSTTTWTGSRTSSPPTDTSRRRSRRVQPKVLAYSRSRSCSATSARDASTASAASLGAAFNMPQVGRGAAYGDYDRRRRSRHSAHQQSGARAVAEKRRRQQEPLADHPARLARRANRDGIGAVVRVESASGVQMQTVHSGSSATARRATSR